MLHLLPDGVVSGCFLYCSGHSIEAEGSILGQWNAETNSIEINEDSLENMRRLALQIPKKCKKCLNIYHCARDCPEVCIIKSEVETVLQGVSPAIEEEGFRCRVQRKLAEHWIIQAAEPLLRAKEEIPI